MQRVLIASFTLLILFIFALAAPISAQDIEVAPRITDREIVERLTRLEEGQKFMIKHFEQRFDDMNQRFDDMNQRFVDINQRFVDINQRFVDMNQRITDMQSNTDRRFDDMNQRFDDMNQRLTDQTQTMLAMFGTLIAMFIGLFGFIVWDRRTMFRPIKVRLERIELELGIEPDKKSRPASPRSKAAGDVQPPDSAVHGAARA